jgi:hypothetical protein
MMNLRMGSQEFQNVEVPLLWGDRAILQDGKGRLSVIDLSTAEARVEVLADEPSPGASFRPQVDGFVLLQDGRELYSYNPKEKLLSSITLDLPDVQISEDVTRIGTNHFSRNRISGYGVGIAVRSDGIALGASLPPGLAKLAI